MEGYFRYWGKGEKDGASYHLLPYHTSHKIYYVKLMVGILEITVMALPLGKQVLRITAVGVPEVDSRTVSLQSTVRDDLSSLRIVFDW